MGPCVIFILIQLYSNHLYLKNISFLFLIFHLFHYTGHKNLVAPLIDGGADPNVRNGKGFTLLHQAIVEEDSRTAIYLLDHGADMDAL